MAPDLHPDLAHLLPTDLRTECVLIAYVKGSRLFTTGERPTHMHFVNEGEVVLERAGADGSNAILQRTRRGFVSEASLGSSQYHCDAHVVTAATITQIPISSITSALAIDPMFSARWIDMLNREVRRLRMHCERLSLPKVQDRLTHLLATQGDSGRYAMGSGLKSIASELGVTHEALYRCVASLEKQGRLARQDGFLVLQPLGV